MILLGLHRFDAVVSSHIMRRFQNTWKNPFCLGDPPAFSRIPSSILGTTVRHARPKRKSVEEDLQRECAKLIARLEIEHPWPLRCMFHSPNGGWRTAAEAGKFKACGVKPGVPDWLCPIPHKGWNGLAIELKSEAGRVSESQQRWLDDLGAAGYLVGVVRRLEDFERIVSRYLDGK